MEHIWVMRSITGITQSLKSLQGHGWTASRSPSQALGSVQQSIELLAVNGGLGWEK